jgi:hypothetical protein
LTVSSGAAVVLHAVAAPLILTGLAICYFRARGSRDPLPTATVFTAIVAVLDAVIVAGLVLRDFAMFTNPAGSATARVYLPRDLDHWSDTIVDAGAPTCRRGRPQSQCSAGA